MLFSYITVLVYDLFTLFCNFECRGRMTLRIALSQVVIEFKEHYIFNQFICLVPLMFLWSICFITVASRLISYCQANLLFIGRVDWTNGISNLLFISYCQSNLLFKFSPIYYKESDH